MPHTFRETAHALLLALLVLGASAAQAQSATNASTLLAQRAVFQTQLQAKVFGEPLHLVSQDDGHRMDANVYAELDLPFARVSTVLGAVDSVCGLLSLHLNVRSCLASHGATGDVLTLSAGPKQGANVGAVYSMRYTMQVEASTADYLRVNLVAASGPMFTGDYRIVFEVTPLEGQRSFLHFGYAYNYGSMAKMAMSVYLATAGRTKIGFTVVGTGADGRPQYVQGERGSVERNVMRNYLALLAYAGVNTGTQQAQTEARLHAWFALTERHAPQLHELTLDEYLQEKHSDMARVATQ